MAHNDKPKKKAPAEGGTVANSAPAKGLGLPGSTSHYIHQTADAVGMLHASRIIISCICKHNMQTTNRRRGGWGGGGGALWFQRAGRVANWCNLRAVSYTNLPLPTTPYF